MASTVGWRATEGSEDPQQLISMLIKALELEITTLRSGDGDVQLKVTNGRLVFRSPEVCVYRFPLDTDTRIDDDTPVEILIDGSVIDGDVISSDDEGINVSTKIYFGDGIRQAVIVNDTSKLLEALVKRLEERGESFNLEGSMRLFGLREHRFEGPGDGADLSEYDLNDGQREAVKKSIKNGLVFIWGPPGTGKTKTLSTILEQLIISGKTVLLTSHTHLAVDEVFKKFGENPENQRFIEGGKIVRYGVSHNPNPDLLKFQLDYIVKAQCKELFDEIDALNEKISQLKTLLKQYKMVLQTKKYQDIIRLNDELAAYQEELENIEAQLSTLNEDGQYSADRIPLANEKTRLEVKIGALDAKIGGLKMEYSLTDEEFDLIIASPEISEKYNNEILGYKAKIRDLKDRIEEIKKASVETAQVVGCTLTKAYIDSKVYARRFDYLIIDEASMAGLPALFYVAGLASNYVVSGDFRQLSPIAKSGKKEAQRWLKRDIFDQAGVTRRIDNGYEDERLAMLKIQYRMHPDITVLINKRFYNGELITSEEIIEDRRRINELAHIGGRAVVLCDTSSINPRSSIPKGGSRVNEYSALLSVVIVDTLLKNGIENIGVITPYKSQAKLITEMLEESKIPKSKVVAATIHKFQGNQRQTIIIDLVDGPPNNVGVLLKGPTIKSEASKLLNVAVSRAEGKLVIIANRDYFMTRLTPGDIVYDMLKDIDFCGEVVSSESILPPTFEPLKKTDGAESSKDDSVNDQNTDAVKEYLSIDNITDAIRNLLSTTEKDNCFEREVVIKRLVLLAQKFGLRGEYNYRSNYGSSYGFIDVAWRLKNKPLVVMEFDSSLREKSIKKLITSDVKYKFWIYSGKKPYGDFIKRLDPNSQISVIYHQQSAIE